MSSLLLTSSLLLLLLLLAEWMLKYDVTAARLMDDSADAWRACSSLYACFASLTDDTRRQKQ